MEEPLLPICLQTLADSGLSTLTAPRVGRPPVTSLHDIGEMMRASDDSVAVWDSSAAAFLLPRDAGIAPTSLARAGGRNTHLRERQMTHRPNAAACATSRRFPNNASNHQRLKNLQQTDWYPVGGVIVLGLKVVWRGDVQTGVASTQELHPVCGVVRWWRGARSRPDPCRHLQEGRQLMISCPSQAAAGVSGHVMSCRLTSRKCTSSLRTSYTRTAVQS